MMLLSFQKQKTLLNRSLTKRFILTHSTIRVDEKYPANVTNLIMPFEVNQLHQEFAELFKQLAWFQYRQVNSC